MSMNYLNDWHKNHLINLLQNYEEMIDGTLGKYKKHYKAKTRCQTI